MKLAKGLFFVAALGSRFAAGPDAMTLIATRCRGLL